MLIKILIFCIFKSQIYLFVLLKNLIYKNSNVIAENEKDEFFFLSSLLILCIDFKFLRYTSNIFVSKYKAQIMLSTLIEKISNDFNSIVEILLFIIFIFFLTFIWWNIIFLLNKCKKTTLKKNNISYTCFIFIFFILNLFAFDYFCYTVNNLYISENKVKIILNILEKITAEDVIYITKLLYLTSFIFFLIFMQKCIILLKKFEYEKIKINWLYFHFFLFNITVYTYFWYFINKLQIFLDITEEIQFILKYLKEIYYETESFFPLIFIIFIFFLWKWLKNKIK